MKTNPKDSKDKMTKFEHAVVMIVAGTPMINPEKSSKVVEIAIQRAKEIFKQLNNLAE